VGAAGDFAGGASTSTVVSGPFDTAFTWTTTPSLASDVQTWLDAPSTNFGWILINEDEVTTRTQKVFYSREATQNSSEIPNSLDPSWRPQLSVKFTPPPTGDYNGNGFVDAADYVLWRKTVGQPATPAGSGADGDKSGTIDAPDYTYWRARLGTIVNGVGTVQQVPEPAYAAWLLMGVLAYSPRRR
jgi:hypothetical protein